MILQFSGRADGAAEAVHAGGDGEGADGAQPVQGALHGAPRGRQVSESQMAKSNGNKLF